MGLRFDPVGGGQLKQAVKQIIEAESLPVKQLETRKGREEARLKLFNEFKQKFAGIDKAVNEIATFKKFRELKVDLGDGQGLVSVTLDKEKAQPGTYSISVDELAQRTSVISNGFTDPAEPVLGIGFINMNLANGESAEIFVDEKSSSLNGVAALINQRKDSPVRAAVVKDAGDIDNPWRLILTAKKDGYDNQIDYPSFYFLDGQHDFYIEDDKESQNAQVVVDGFALELESNDVTDFLPGVNLHLKQARPDSPFTIQITEDHQKVAGKVKALVDQLNGIFAFITQQNKVDENTDTRSTFAGDTGLQGIEYRLRNLLHEGFYVGDAENPRLVHLHQLGLEFDKGGQIQFKEEKFVKVMESGFDDIAEAITGEFGFAHQMREVLNGYTRPGNGMLAVREQGLRARIKQMDQQIDNKNRNLEKRQQALTEKFSRLEAALGNLQRQQQYVAAALPGGGGGSVVSQLLG